MSQRNNFLITGKFTVQQQAQYPRKKTTKGYPIQSRHTEVAMSCKCMELPKRMRTCITTEPMNAYVVLEGGAGTVGGASVRAVLNMV